ncbi:hypothetical protein [Rhizobium pisi]|uniref:glycine-rich domain-containing protein n=1 Tax=Rhizobium pisi TaxID=574561 RepID=UPI003CFE5ED7
MKITESLGQVDLGQWLLDKATLEYDGPLTLTKDIVNFRCAMIGGGGGGETTDAARTSWGGWPGATYLFEGKLSDIPTELYVFIGSGGQGAYTPDPENVEWDTGAPSGGSTSQFYLWDKIGNNHPEGAGGMAGGGDAYLSGDAGQRQTWARMQMYYDVRIPDPLIIEYNGKWGNATGPGPGGPYVISEEEYASFGGQGGQAFISDPLRLVEAGYDDAANGFDAPDIFGACGSGGSASYSGTKKGGNGGAPGGGGAGSINGHVGGDGAPGQIHIELSIWEIA